MSIKRLAWTLALVVGGAVAASPCWANWKAAEKYYRAQDYERAAAAFYQVFTKEKQPSLHTKAQWGLAISLRKAEHFYSAAVIFSRIVGKGAQRSNPFFRQALEELVRINEQAKLGQEQIFQLFSTTIEPAHIPPEARSFYFYYKGVESFAGSHYKKAQSLFRRVQEQSPYFIKALFHLGVIASLSNQSDEGISYFEQVKFLARELENGPWLVEQANLNIARTHYAATRYSEAIRHYAQIPRDSDNWLEALFEAAWAFLLMEKANNALGNIHTLHSPFFTNRLLPESYILQAITFLRLCRYDKVKESLAVFKARYGVALKDIKALLKESEANPTEFFRKVHDYAEGSLQGYKRAWPLLDSLARTDIYKQASSILRSTDKELTRLSQASRIWETSGLQTELKSFLQQRKSTVINEAGRRLFRQGVRSYKTLIELSNQTKLITAELMLGKVDALRAELSIEAAAKKENFIGGMQPLVIGQDLEYWPFEEEYWKDEAGGYVYNIASVCPRADSSNN